MADHYSVNVHDESECFDDDGRLKRRGSVWTASAHIITAVIDSGVLVVAWATAQLGWIAGPAILLLFSFITYYTSNLLSDCFRTGDQVTGKRNCTYMDAVRANLGWFHVKICGILQYANIVGVAIGYTIASSISMVAVKRSNCFHNHGRYAACSVSSTPYMIMFGVMEIIVTNPRFRGFLLWLLLCLSLTLPLVLV